LSAQATKVVVSGLVKREIEKGNPKTSKTKVVVPEPVEGVPHALIKLEFVLLS